MRGTKSRPRAPAPGAPAWMATACGTLPVRGPGARGIERAGRNPDCTTLAVLTAAGVSPADVAERVYGLANAEGQSPLAIHAGNQFERVLYGQNGAKLVATYEAKLLLTTRDPRVVNVPDFAPGTSPGDLARRLAVTQRFLRQKRDRHPDAPHIIIKPRLLLPVVGQEYAIEPDYAVADDGDPFYMLGEVKSYRDRRGKTDTGDLKGALRQVAVGVLALRSAARALNIDASEAVMPPVVDIVLRKGGGGYTPSLTRMRVEGEVDSVRRTLAGLPARVGAVRALLEGGATLDDPVTLAQIPTNYMPSCKEHCPLARRCKREAFAAGDPALLGAEAREALVPAGSISRVWDLADGVAKPRTDDERAIQQTLLDANRAIAEAFRGAARG